MTNRAFTITAGRKTAAIQTAANKTVANKTVASGLSLLALLALSACADGGSPFNRGGTQTGTAKAESVKLVDRDVEAPEVFQTTDDALWDGRPSLGGVWVASPDATDPERVILRNTANGKFVIGALFRREAFNPGPKLQLSSDAAEALGLLAGAPASISVTALRREEAPAEVDASKPILDANEGIQTTALADAAPADTAPADTALATTASAAIDAADPAAKPAMAPAKIAAGIATGQTVTGQTVTGQTAPAPAVKPARKPGPAIPVVSGKQGGTLQIGIFSVEDNANRAAAALKKSGVQATVRKDTTQGKTWWSVTAKGAGDRAAFLAKVKGLGFKDAYFVKG